MSQYNGVPKLFSYICRKMLSRSCKTNRGESSKIKFKVCLGAKKGKYRNAENYRKI